MSSSLTLKVTSALSREGVSCEASNTHGKKQHVFHFGSGEELQGWEEAAPGSDRALPADPSFSPNPSLQWPPRLPRPAWLSWPWPSAWASCFSSSLPSTA